MIKWECSSLSQQEVWVGCCSPLSCFWACGCCNQFGQVVTILGLKLLLCKMDTPFKTSKNSCWEEQTNPAGVSCSVQGHTYLQLVPGVLALAPCSCAFSDARVCSGSLSIFPTVPSVKLSFYECVHCKSQWSPQCLFTPRIIQPS